MPFNEDQVRDELKRSLTPSSLSILSTLDWSTWSISTGRRRQGKCDVEMTMTSPMCPAGPQLVANSRQVVESMEGVGKVEIKVVMDPAWSQDRMTEDARDQLGIFRSQETDVTRMTSAPTIPSLDEIRSDLLDLESPQDRLTYLIELGDALPAFDESWKTEENRVLGCQSMVRLVSQAQGDRLVFKATSDVPMVRGLIAILLAAYSDRLPTSIVEFPIRKFFDDVKLSSFISPMRSNGLYSMVQKIQQIAESVLPGGVHPMDAPFQECSLEW